LRVLIVCASTAWGGLETHAAAVAEYLAAAGHDAVIVGLGRAAGDLFRGAALRGVEVVEMDPPARGFLWQWWRRFRGLEADVAVLEKGTLWTGGLALDWILRLRYPRYVAIQQLEPPHLPPRNSRRHLGGLVRGIGLWWYRWKWSGYARSVGPALTVCVSQSVARRLATDYAFADQKLVTIPNGVDPTKFEPDLDARRRMRQAWGVPQDAIVFGSVGRFSPQKALDVAVDAFGRAVRANPGHDLHLVFVGDGTERSALVERVRTLGLQEQVRFPGFMANPHDAYQAFDVFLIPSRYEGLPFAMLEAMASGCEVIGTAVGGIPEVITDATMGTLVPPENADALAEAISTFLSRDASAREARRRASRQRVVDGFDIRRQSAQLLALLNPDASQPGGPSRDVTRA
jgi:glycosyltransferase involved in cell wall biosynthesis